MQQPQTIERFFVCIGAQKAGTTWLARALGRHPSLFLTPVKEIHYFDHVQGITEHLSERKRRSRYRKFHQRMWTQWHRWRAYRAQAGWYRAYMANPIDDDWYVSLFRDRAGRVLAGEATPEYALIGEDGLAHLKRLAPDARLIYVMRNPVTRAWSQVLHLCRAQGLDAARATPAALIALAESEAVRAHGDYLAVLTALERVFAAEQTLIAFYEDMHADRQAALAGLCTFLGVAYDPAYFPDLERRLNRSQAAAMPAEVRAHLRARHAGSAAAIERRLGRVPEAWRREFAAAP